MRSRKWMLPKVIRAGAGPHNLGSGDNKGGAFPELTLQPETELTMVNDEDDNDDEPDIVVRNTPYVRSLPCPFISALIFAFRTKSMIAGLPLQITYSR